MDKNDILGILSIIFVILLIVYIIALIVFWVGMNMAINTHSSNVVMTKYFISVTVLTLLGIVLLFTQNEIAIIISTILIFISMVLVYIMYFNIVPPELKNYIITLLIILTIFFVFIIIFIVCIS